MSTSASGVLAHSCICPIRARRPTSGRKVGRPPLPTLRRSQATLPPDAPQVVISPSCDPRQGGLFDLWNRSHPSLAVLPGDHIVSANGIHGDAKSLYSECLKPQVLTLVLQRPAPPRDREAVHHGQ